MSEIQGRHHRMFVDPADQAGQDDCAFWDALRRGDFQARQFKRLDKDGKVDWIKAAYYPILDPSGGLLKVVK